MRVNTGGKFSGTAFILDEWQVGQDEEATLLFSRSIVGEVDICLLQLF